MIVGENVFRVKDLTIQQHSGSLAAFWRTVQDMIMPLRTFFRATHNNFKRFNYLEEWHSYPSFLPEPSATDHKSMREMIENPKLGANFVVLMVVKLNGARQLQGSLTVYQAGHQEVRGDIIVHPKMDGDGRIYLDAP